MKTKAIVAAMLAVATQTAIAFELPQPPPPPRECGTEFRLCTPHAPPFAPEEIESIRACVENDARTTNDTACTSAMDRLELARPKS